MKKLLIKQPAGLGDICFLQKLATEQQNWYGYEVYWPISPVYTGLNNYINNFHYPSLNEDFPFKEEYLQCARDSQVETDNFKIICTDGASGPNGVMKSKYESVAQRWEGWQDYFHFTRNHKKENELYYDILNLKDSEEYIFINDYMGTPPNDITKLDLNPNKIGKKIKLEFIEGFSLFDWSKVVENALEIYIEGSALAYIIEHLNVKTKGLFLFSRNHKHIEDIFSKNWKKRYSNKHQNFKDL